MTATHVKVTLNLNTVTDADVIKYLNAQANKNDTIRRALRERMVVVAWQAEMKSPRKPGRSKLVYDKVTKTIVAASDAGRRPTGLSISSEDANMI